MVQQLLQQVQVLLFPSTIESTVFNQLYWIMGGAAAAIALGLLVLRWRARKYGATSGAPGAARMALFVRTLYWAATGVILLTCASVGWTASQHYGFSMTDLMFLPLDYALVIFGPIVLVVYAFSRSGRGQ